MAVATTQADPPPLSERARRRALPVILAGTFMAIFDMWVVTVAGPSIQVGLDTGKGGLALVVAGYSFAYAVGVVTGGRMGDRYGRRRIYVIGLAAFSAASLVCGIAPSAPWLVSARLAQGFSAALLVPQVLSLISTLFPVRERPRAFTLFAVANGLGGVSGQAVGGLIVHANIAGLGWRAIFLVNVPIGMAAIVATIRLIPENHSRDPERIDGLGMALATVGLGAVLAPLVLGPDSGWPAWTLVSVACALPLLAAFAWYELNEEAAGRSPMLHLRVLRTRPVISGLAATAGCFACFAGLQFSTSLFLQRDLGQSPLRVGLTWAWASVVFVPAALIARRVGARYGRVVPALGATTTAAGIAALLVLIHVERQDLASVPVALTIAVIGLGYGFVTPSLVGVVLIGVPRRFSGAASGVLLTAQQLSSATGVAIVGSVYYGAGGGDGSVMPIQVALLVVLTLSIGAAGATLVLPRNAPQ